MSYKVKYTLSTLLWQLLIDIYPRGIRICSHNNLFINVHNSFIHNDQKLETQMSISWWKGNLCGIPTTQQQRNNFLPQYPWISQASSWVKEARYKRLQNSWFQLDEIIEMAKYTDRKQISDCQRRNQWEDWMQRGRRKLFGGMETVYPVTVVVVIQLYTFVNTHWST